MIFLLICCIAVNAQFASDTGDLDLFANNDESLLSEEPSTESSSSFNPDPDNIILNDHSYENFDLASISCLPPSPPLSPSRKFKLRTREAGDACVSSEQTYNPALLSESVRSYWCPVNLRMQLEAMSSGFGSIPVCDTDPIWAGPSELDLEDWGERVLPSSGLINLAECYPRKLALWHDCLRREARIPI